MSFKKYSELLSHLLIVERHNDFLIKNHESRPVGSMPFTEVNQVNYHQRKRDRFSYRGRGSGHDRDHGCKINYNHDGRLAPTNNQQYKRKGEMQEEIQKKNSKIVCHRCGGIGTGRVLADHLSVWFSFVRHF